MATVIQGSRGRLAAIPKAKLLQDRLDELNAESERIRILLRVANELEQVDSPIKHGGDDAK